MIKSLLDNDLQKFALLYAIFTNHYEDYEVSYKFYNRGTQTFDASFLKRFKRKIQEYKNLKLDRREIDYLKSLKLFKNQDFFTYLENYSLDPSDVVAALNSGKLSLYISGKWSETVLWEVILLSLINEVYFGKTKEEWSGELENYKEKSKLKVSKILDQTGVPLMEFGTRRRRSPESQLAFLTGAIEAAKENKCLDLLSTSNLYLSKELGLPCSGSMNHEWIVAHEALSNETESNLKAAKAWRKAFIELGVFLPDTYTSDLCFNNFSEYYAHHYLTMRQDSGDPKVFTDKLYEFYSSVKDPKIDLDKIGIIYSDSINSIDQSAELVNYAKEKLFQIIKLGIGTWFTNDFEHSPALNIVIKLYTFNGRTVYKTSDDPNKSTKDALS